MSELFNKIVKKFKSFDWASRFANKTFWAQIVASVIIPVLAYFGLEVKDLTSWGILGNVLLDAISNPYVVVMVIVGVVNAFTNPTTKGLSDGIKDEASDEGSSESV